MNHSINITRRERKRRLKDRTTTVQLRYVVNYIDPETQKRAQKFFEKRRDAEVYKQSLIVDIQSGEYFSRREEVTVGDVVALWFSAREGKIKPNSLRNHLSIRPLILGPLLCGAEARQRAEHTMSGDLQEGSQLGPCWQMSKSEISPRPRYASGTIFWRRKWAPIPPNARSLCSSPLWS